MNEKKENPLRGATFICLRKVENGVVLWCDPTITNGLLLLEQAKVFTDFGELCREISDIFETSPLGYNLLPKMKPEDF